MCLRPLEPFKNNRMKEKNINNIYLILYKPFDVADNQDTTAAPSERRFCTASGSRGNKESYGKERPRAFYFCLFLKILSFYFDPIEFKRRFLRKKQSFLS